MDVLSIVNNVQQVPPGELAASQKKTNSSTRLHSLVSADINIIDAHADKGIRALIMYL